MLVSVRAVHFRLLTNLDDDCGCVKVLLLLSEADLHVVLVLDGPVDKNFQQKRSDS